MVTLSGVNREIKNAVDALVKRDGKTSEQARTEVEAKRAELILSIINDELIMQKGKEIGVEKGCRGRSQPAFRAVDEGKQS